MTPIASPPRALAARILLAWLAALALLAAPAATARADTAVGDWGHFLVGWSKIHLHNPDGRAFTIDLHPMPWVTLAWNEKVANFRLSGPDGKPMLAGPRPLEGGACRIEIPAGAPGVYLLEPNIALDGTRHKPGGGALWVASSLDRSVVWTGDPTGHAIEGQRLVTHCAVPRRWWFWVPPGVTSFVAKAQRADRFMSQREDWGYTFISPRGQRIAAMWGQPLPPKPGEPYRAEMSVTVPVEPGSGGRFWAVEVRYGDSHNYSKPNLCFEGVPPYVARSPEEWFDPTTGKTPDVPAYDDDPFMQYAPEARAEKWPGLQHFSPSPALGDPDGAMVRGDATVALWNPQDRPLRFRLGTYLPRRDASNPETADLTLTHAAGAVALKQTVPLFHLHEPGKNLPEPLASFRKGVGRLSVSQAERWFFFTYPATPLVLLGRKTPEDDWGFEIEVGGARNWYFFVPRGTKRFAVRAACKHEADVLELQVNAPDRTVALIYDQKGEKVIDVPPGLDGKIWHLRVDLGSGTRLVPGPDPLPRPQGLFVTLGLKGVPGLLAPTWEQWFDPSNPREPMRRNEAAQSTP